MKYLISQQDINWSKNRWIEKGYGFLEGLFPNGEYKTKKGYIGLYDRNINKFYWFKIIEKCLDKMAYITERKTSIKGYWRNLNSLL